MSRSLAFVRRRPLLYRLLGLVRLAVFRAGLTLREWRFSRAPESAGGLPLPSPGMRFRVGGSFGAATFLRIGAACAGAIRDAARAGGSDLAACRSILDFSCGCGRVIRHLAPMADKAEIYGADTDEAAVRWCRENLGGMATFDCTGIVPPLPYGTGQFDLIYVVSLFTHLDERLQHLWLAELARVLAPGGLLIATFHGRHSQRDLPEADKDRIARDGFAFQIGQTGRLKLDGLPDYYQAAYHSEAYIRDRWSAYLDPILFRERGMNDDQDIAVLRKPR